MWGRGSPHLQACKKRAHQTPTRSAARQVAITTHHRSGFSQFLHREPERPCARTNCDQHTHTTHNGTYATKQTRALVWGKNRISLRLEPRRARSERQAVDTTAKTSTSTRLRSAQYYLRRCHPYLTSSADREREREGGSERPSERARERERARTRARTPALCTRAPPHGAPSLRHTGRQTRPRDAAAPRLSVDCLF